MLRIPGQYIGDPWFFIHDDRAHCFFLTAPAEQEGEWMQNDVGHAISDDLIQWEAIEWSIRNGHKVYEIIGANTRNLCDFKSRYSPELDIFFTIKKANLLGNLIERLYLALYKRGRE